MFSSLDKQSLRCVILFFLILLGLSYLTASVVKHKEIQHVKEELEIEAQFIVSQINEKLDMTESKNIVAALRQRRNEIIALLPTTLIYTHTLYLLNENTVFLEYKVNDAPAAPISISMPISTLEGIKITTYAFNDKLENINGIRNIILAVGVLVSLMGAILMCFFKRSIVYNEEIAKAQNFNKMIMDNIPDILFVKDKNFRIVNANKHFMAFYPEDKQDQIIGYTTIESYEEKESQEFLAEDKKAFDFGFSKTIETILFPDKKTRTLSTQKVRFEDDDGKEFILGVSNDITEQVEIQKDLEKSQAFLRMIIDHFPGLLFVKDEQSKIIYANDQFKSIYPLDKQDKIIGHTTYENYPHNQKEKLIAWDKQAFREGYIEEATSITYPNGEIKDVTIKKVCFADSYGNQYLLCVASENVKNPK